MGAFDIQGFESPEEVRSRIGKAQLASTIPQGNVNQQIYQAAAESGTLLGQGVEGAFGLEQPEVTEAREVQDLLQNTDMSSSTSLYKTISKLTSKGKIKEALFLTNKANEIRKIEASEVPDPSKLTRFKGVLDGKNVAAFSDPSGNVYARVGGDLVKNPAGLTEIVTGKSEFDDNITKKTKGDLEKRLINSSDALVRLDDIDSAYNKQSLTYGGKLESLYTKVKETVGFDLSPEEADFLDRDTNMRQQVFDNMNTYIHDMSGAAVTVQEAARLSKAMPTMADSPTEFKRKLKNVIERMRSIISMNEFWRT